MRKKNREIQDPAILTKILKESKICRLAMVEGRDPYLLPFNYGYSENCIYIHSASEGGKLIF